MRTVSGIRFDWRHTTTLGVLIPSLLFAGGGQLVVEVTVVDVPGAVKNGDERPARVALDFPELIGQAGLTGEADLSGLRITRVGQLAASGPKFAYSAGAFDLPLRWDDECIAGKFSTVDGIVNNRTGELIYEAIVNDGLYYNVLLPSSKKGQLVWTHFRGGQGPAIYRVEVPVGVPKLGGEIPPRGWIGDGVARFSTSPDSTTGSPHTRVDVTDWNSDGLPDIVYGENYGKVLVLLNQGRTNHPLFTAAVFALDTSGRAMDAGISAAPLVVDWDQDGQEDLLVGTHWNRILFFKNIGSNRDRQFANRGFVTINGQPLELPITPVVGRPAGAFSRDYYPVLATVDWDSDGRTDLVAGGYLTGRIYVFRNCGTGSDGSPALSALGPIEADGKIINAGDWAAAPALADLNGDGLFDIITGNYPMTAAGHAGAPLRYFLNVGREGRAVFRESPLPRTGEWPPGRMYSPRLVDMNQDGLLDLVVSSHANIFLWLNKGTKETPLFSLDAAAIRPAQGNARLPVSQFIDWNGDGQVDLVNGYSVQLNLAKGDPFQFASAQPLLPANQNIEHPSGIGDGWFHPRFFDYDHDGDYDILFGDWYGQVWLHRKTAEGYDVPGRLLTLESGEPIKVGPGKEKKEESFQALQGARTVLAAHSFVADGLTDLIVGDTYGIIRYFKNVQSNEAPLYREVQVLGNLGNRLSVEIIDWDMDGFMDVISGSSNGRVRVFLNQPGKPQESRFGEGFDPKLPQITQPRIITVDLNNDGDVDLYVPSTKGSVWLERSFVRHGYAEGKVTAVRAER